MTDAAVVWQIVDGRTVCPACASTIAEAWVIGDDTKPLPATCPACGWPTFPEGMGYFE